MNDSTITANIIQDIRLAEKLFNEDRISEAYYLIKNIEQYVAQLSLSIQHDIDNELNSSEDVNDIKIEGDRISALLSLFEDTESWNVWNSGVGTNNDVTVCIHKDEQLGQHFIKIDGRLHCELQHALAALLEHELYRHWMPLCRDVSCIAGLTPYRRIMRANFDFTLLQKETVYSTHGDVLPDGSVLVTVNPLTEMEEEQYQSKFHAAERLHKLKPLPPMEDRLILTGGFLLQEIEADVLPPIGEMFQSKKAKKLIHRKLSQTNITRSPTMDSGVNANIDTSHQSNYDSIYPADSHNNSIQLLSDINISETAFDRMTIMNHRAEQAIVTSNNLQSARTIRELEKYNTPISELYGVPDNIPNNTTRNANTVMTGSGVVKEQINPLLEILNKVKKRQKVVYVRGIFKIDPKLSFFPDWIFNMSVRSAVSMIIPMMEHQAKLFIEGGLFREKMIQNKALYDEINNRLKEIKDKNASDTNT